LQVRKDHSMQGRVDLVRGAAQPARLYGFYA